MPAGVEELIAYCRLRLSEEEAERLVCWIAWRTGRNQALAGARQPLARLRHAVENWLGPQERALLLAWMRRRADRAEPPVPG